MSYINHINSYKGQLEKIKRLEIELTNKKLDYKKSKQREKYKYVFIFFRYLAEVIVLVSTWLKYTHLQIISYIAVLFFLFGALGDFIKIEDIVIINRDIIRIEDDIEKLRRITGRPSDLQINV